MEWFGKWIPTFWRNGLPPFSIASKPMLLKICNHIPDYTMKWEARPQCNIKILAKILICTGIPNSSNTHVFNKTINLYLENIQILLTFIYYLLTMIRRREWWKNCRVNRMRFELDLPLRTTQLHSSRGDLSLENLSKSVSAAVPCVLGHGSFTIVRFNRCYQDGSDLEHYIFCMQWIQHMSRLILFNA